MAQSHEGQKILLRAEKHFYQLSKQYTGRLIKKTHDKYGLLVSVPAIEEAGAVWKAKHEQLIKGAWLRGHRNGVAVAIPKIEEGGVTVQVTTNVPPYDMHDPHGVQQALWDFADEQLLSMREGIDENDVAKKLLSKSRMALITTLHAGFQAGHDYTWQEMFRWGIESEVAKCSSSPSSTP